MQPLLGAGLLSSIRHSQSLAAAAVSACGLPSRRWHWGSGTRFQSSAVAEAHPEETYEAVEANGEALSNMVSGTGRGRAIRRVRVLRCCVMRPPTAIIVTTALLLPPCTRPEPHIMHAVSQTVRTPQGERASTSQEQQQQQPWVPAVQDAEAAAAVAEEPPSDGTVQYKNAPLWLTIRDHYRKLEAIMPQYTARVDLDTFGSLYVEQVRREEAARQAALVAHQKQVERDARQGRPSRQVGGVLSNVMRSWIQLLQEAVEAEHQEVRRCW